MPRRRNSLPVWVSGRDLQLDAAIQRRYIDLAPEGRIHKADRHLAVEVFAIALEECMFAHMHLNIEITGGTAMGAGLPLAGQADPVTGIHPGGDLDLQCSGFLHRPDHDNGYRGR